MSGPGARLRDRIGGGRAVALIDGNSFYCSCERVFDPKLAAVPVIVLDRDDPMRSVSTTVQLPEHTSDTLALIKAARHGVAKTWREPGERPWRYAKAGIVTNDLVPLSHSPRALIGALDRERSEPLMAAVDACNARWGRGAVVPARAGLVSRRDWNTKFEMRTPRYTTQVSELPVAYA